MKGIDSLKVVPFTRNRVPNRFPGGNLSWQTYHTVRNAIVQACRKHGPTGPMGLIKIVDHVADPYRQLVKDFDFWESGDPDPMYFILDDQLNHERYCYAELSGDDPFNIDWLTSIVSVLRQHKGWGLGINHIPDSYVLIFGNRIMVKGRKLSRCQSVDDVIEVVSYLLRRGPKKWWQFWK